MVLGDTQSYIGIYKKAQTFPLRCSVRDYNEESFWDLKMLFQEHVDSE